MGVGLYIGGHATSIQGEPQCLGGDRMWTAAWAPQTHRPAGALWSMLDSGAFTDAPRDRLTPDAALDRQLAFEQRASEVWQTPFRANALVSYDLLIDETWIDGERHKRRWSLVDADRAVDVTVAAAAYISSQRLRLAPRALVLSAQGVSPLQYSECAAGVLQHAQPGDWFGLGGWCVLGRFTRLLPSFWQTIRLVLPMVRVAGLTHVHIFGVLYLPALGGLLWLADTYGLTVSTDSTAPMLSCTRGDAKKAGVREAYWLSNIAWWKHTLAGLRTSRYYREPPRSAITEQLGLFDLCQAAREQEDHHGHC